MKSLTRKLLLSTLGGGLLVLGLLTAYNMVTTNSPVYGIPTILFWIGCGFAFWNAFN